MSAHRHRCGRVVTAVTAVGALLTLGITPLGTAPTAHADLEDLFLQPLAEAVVMLDPSLAGDLDAANPLASLETMFADIDQSLGWVSGVSGSAADTSSTIDTITATDLTSASVPLVVQGGTEPVANISVGGGSFVPVLVDTGSAGLVLPIWDIGWQNIGFPTAFGMGSYAGGMGYFYATVPTTVDFGKDLATQQDIPVADTSVNALLFAFPTSLGCLLSGCWDIHSFLSSTGANADGILGIGPNAYGPTPDSIPTAELPGTLGHGVLIDQANGRMTFGDNPLTNGTAVNGSPNAMLGVQITPPGGTATPTQQVSSIIDSGGVNGALPASVANAGGIAGASGALPVGTQVSVYTPGANPTLLYSYTVDSTNSPSVFSGSGLMNTGNLPFAQQPIYTSYSPPGHGTTIFGGPPAIEL